jgi:MbtH protein
MPDERGSWRVVKNLEEQYSLLCEGESNPAGWSDVGKEGTKAECLAYIVEVWTDMRPLSLRRTMDLMLAKDKAN